MNQIETNKAVRDWLTERFPGTFIEANADACVRKAWAAFGSGNVEMFKNALKFHGFQPEKVGPRWVLRLPSRYANPRAEQRRRAFLHIVEG